MYVGVVSTYKNTTTKKVKVALVTQNSRMGPADNKLDFLLNACKGFV